MTPSTEQTTHSYYDAALLFVIILSLFAALPLLANPQGLPNGDDVLYHIYRAAEMERSWLNGALFPRWADGLYFGYGSPLWHFYAPLTYYITAGLSSVLGWGIVNALRGLIVISFLLAGMGMYGFMRGTAGRLGGLLSAIAYVYSPYIVFTLPYARGAYPELLALALFPWVMWHTFRTIRQGRTRDSVLTVLALFLLIMTHNLSGVVLVVILMMWVVFNAIAAATVTPLPQRRERVRPYALVIGVIVLAIALAGTFWVPILLERDTVNLQNLIGVSLLDYRDYFVPLGELLQPIPVPDTGAVNGLRRVLVTGVAQWVLALAGFMSVLLLVLREIMAGHRDEQRLRQGVFWGGLSIALIFLMTPTASGLWASLSPLTYLQFPWRLLGPLAFALACLVGMNALWIQQLKPARGSLLSGALILIVLVTAAPALVVMEWTRVNVDTSISAYHASEQNGLQIGTTFTDEFRPRAVTTIPGPTPRLLDDYADGYPIDRANVPDTVQTALISSGPMHNEWRVSASEPFTMEVLTFDWAGWTAEVNGQQVPITPSPNHGLITFPVEQGQSTVRVYLGTTAVRVAGHTMSLLALAGLLAYVALNAGSEPRPVTTPEPLSLPYVRGLTGGVVLGVVLLVGLTQIHGIAWLNTPAGQSPAQNQTDFTLDQSFKVLGYDLSTRELSAGDTLRLTVYWYGQAESDVNFSSFVHLGLPDAPPVAQADKLHPGGRAIAEWWGPERGYIYDDYRITIPEGTPAGTYQLYVGLYTCELMPPGDCGNGYRPIVRLADGEELGDRVPLGEIVIR